MTPRLSSFYMETGILEVKHMSIFAEHFSSMLIIFTSMTSTTKRLEIF